MHYGPRPRDADRGRGCAVRSVAAAAAATCVAATLLVLEVRDHLLDLGLVLRLAGLLDQLRRDARSDELPDHACHVRLLVVDCLPPCPAGRSANPSVGVVTRPGSTVAFRCGNGRRAAGGSRLGRSRRAGVSRLSHVSMRTKPCPSQYQRTVVRSEGPPAWESSGP